jgi:eukaryotic-like serine/threonine-protein kinase
VAPRVPGAPASLTYACTDRDSCKVSGDRRGGGFTTPEARVGEALNGKWHVDRLLDVGGMGAVYEGTHRNGRRAALKVLHTRYARDPEVRKRFLREGYVANKIGHPGAVAILDDDTAEDGSPYLVMELLEGESLAGWLQRVGGRLPVSEVLAVAGQVLEVLVAAHGNGIVHRDIKPANVFVTRSGHAKLLDFGLARIRDGAISLIPTAQGVIMGTAGYMAPEQARGTPDQVDARTDLFAIGAVMFRAMSGKRIHEKQTAFDMTVAAMKEQAPSLSTVMPEAGPLLVAAVDRSLAFDKAARWQDARAMFAALRDAYQEQRERPPPLQQTRPQEPTRESIDLPVHYEADEPSIVVDVAFGPQHDEEIERERQRTREVIEGLSGAPIPIAPDALNKDKS